MYSEWRFVKTASYLHELCRAALHLSIYAHKNIAIFEHMMKTLAKIFPTAALQALS